MDSEIMHALKALREYQKANGTLDIADSADALANGTEGLLRLLAERDVEIADLVDLYFNRITPKLDEIIEEFMAG